MSDKANLEAEKALAGLSRYYNDNWNYHTCKWNNPEAFKKRQEIKKASSKKRNYAQ